MFKDLKNRDRVAVSTVSGVYAEIWEVEVASGDTLLVKSTSRPITHRVFSRVTGESVRGDETGKILQEYDIAIKEVGMECPYCGVSQRNFFMACELLQGGKNCNCFYCKKLLWLSPDGNTKKVT
ncbi:MAG: hypothetical protein AAB497_01075 [Patescibacteria group bacterium]